MKLSLEWRRTALHWAVEGGHLEIVRLLIQYGAYAHVVDEYGWNLLHRACIKGHLPVSVTVAQINSIPNNTTKYTISPKSITQQPIITISCRAEPPRPVQVPAEGPKDLIHLKSFFATGGEVSGAAPC